jgi:hypothetical protein
MVQKLSLELLAILAGTIPTARKPAANNISKKLINRFSLRQYHYISRNSLSAFQVEGDWRDRDMEPSGARIKSVMTGSNSIILKLGY